MHKRAVKFVVTVAAGAALGIGSGMIGSNVLDAQAAQTAGAQGAQGRGGGRGGISIPPLIMETDAFADGGIVPQKFAGRGGVQPGFKFTNAPQGTASYAIIFHDIDVAFGGNTGDVLHWIAWNIPASANGIPEGKLPEGAVQGKNITGQNNYMGPA